MKKGKRYLFLFVGLALLWVGLTVACETEPPVILKFSSSPAEISTGESATLSWFVKDATSVSINHGVGVVGNVGNKKVSPPATITYTLIATNSGGAVAKSVVVIVSVTSPPSPDTSPPVISAVNTSGITDSSVTMTWTTNEPATSQVEYGLNTSYGSETSLDTNLVTSHSVALSGLSGGTTFHFIVKSKDEAGNEKRDTDRTFVTSSTADTTAPIISAVSTSAVSTPGDTSSSVIITWTTNEAATSQVIYGLNTSYGSETSLNTNFVWSHSVTLRGLNASTTYHFKVKSKDVSGNEAISSNYTLVTSAADAWLSEAAEHTNAEYGFSVKYPKHWEVTPESKTLFTAHASAQVPAMFVCAVDGADFVEAVTNTLKLAYGDITDIKVGAVSEVTLADGSKGNKAVFEAQIGVQIKGLAIGAQKGGKWIVCAVLTAEVLAPYNETLFTQIGTSLKFNK